MKSIVSILSPFWAITNAFVRKLTRKNAKSLPVPVISIGNIIAGGAGKTEVAIKVAQYCIRKGFKPVIAMRGYQSDWSKKGGYAKNFDSALEMHFPDEALVALKKAPGACVVVGSRRYRYLKQYWSEIEPDLVILDDGFQHFDLFRDLDILVHDFKLPWVLLRDLPSVFEKVKVRISFSEIPKFWKSLKWVRAKYLAQTKVEELKNTEVILFCGIGNPQRVVKFLNEMEIKTIGHRFYKDHKAYGIRDIESIVKWHQSLNSKLKKKIPLVTTLKDYVKCISFCESNGGVQGFEPLCLEIDLVFLENEDILWRAVDECLSIHSS